MENHEEYCQNTIKPGKKWVFEGIVIDMPEDFEEPSEQTISPRSDDYLAPPKYSDGTSWPSNFLEHETVVGYPSDRWAKNDGVDDVLDIVSLFETEGLRCCILDVVALQYYGSERLRNVSPPISRLNCE